VQASGGYVGIAGGEAPFLAAQNVVINLEALSSGAYWTVQGPVPVATFAVVSLPSCGSSYSGMTAIVTGSTTSKWQARCNGSNWLWPDGTTVSG